MAVWQLAALSNTRLNVPPASVDALDPLPHGLVMADAELSTDKKALCSSRLRPRPGPPRPGLPETSEGPPTVRGAT
jgi:hypothetical protein